jgi:hypothetical protein
LKTHIPTHYNGSIYIFAIKNMPLELSLSTDLLQKVQTTLAAEGKVVSIEEADGLLKQQVTRIKLKRLAMRGLNAKEASKLVGICAQTAGAIYRDPEFRKEVTASLEGVFDEIDGDFKVKQKTLHEMLEEQALESFNDLVRMLKQGDLNPSLKVRVHQDFMDRAAETAKHSPKSSSAPNLDAEDLARAVQAAREMDEARSTKLRRIS